MEEKNTNMEELAQNLLARVNELLVFFHNKFAKSYPGITFEMEDNSNKTFMINSFLNASQSTNELQVSICINSETRGNSLRLSSDIAYENGNIIAVGPRVIFDDIGLFSSISDYFLQSLEDFVNKNEGRLIEAVTRQS